MKKKGTFGIVVIMGTLLLAGCSHEHMWQEANCTNPRTCTECGETEGEVLKHTWVEASCNTPKKCSICEETEGEILAHNYAEANYQQPATCIECGATDGEPLTGAFENHGLKISTALDTIYDYKTNCWDDETKTTVAKVLFTNYEVFDSDATHPAKDGYEWKTVEAIVVYGDENAYNYGVGDASFKLDDYYDSTGIGADGNFTVNMNGIEYSECECYTSEYSNSGWENVERCGWSNTIIVQYTTNLLLPKGYDGTIIARYNNGIRDDREIWEFEKEDIVYFRFMSPENLEKGNDEID